MPLVHYDQIRERNTLKDKKAAPALPFFLDFKNLTEEKKKIREQLRQQASDAKQKASQQRDRHFKADGNAIILGEGSSVEDYQCTLQNLGRLSVGEVDYQLRAFLLRPGNGIYLLRMLIHGWKKCPGLEQEVRNIIMHRVLTLIGQELVQETEGEEGRTMGKEVSELLGIIEGDAE